MTEQLPSDPVATPNTDAVIVATSQMHGALVPVDFARAQERRIAELEEALIKVRERLRCTKTAPPSYDVDHHCNVCGSSTAYSKDLIDEVMRP